MIPEALTIELLSDAAFSSGEGTAGEVDAEVQHDELGLPYIGGKTIRGLLRDTWLSMAAAFPDLEAAAERLFGPEGDVSETAILRIGNATLGDDVRDWVKAAVTRQDYPLHPMDILRALTDVRRQTAEERSTGAPAKGSLRALRVIVREQKFNADLMWLSSPCEKELQCLALCALATRHGGLRRNRGLGYIRMVFDDNLDATRALVSKVGA